MYFGTQWGNEVRSVILAVLGSINIPRPTLAIFETPSLSQFGSPNEPTQHPTSLFVFPLSSRPLTAPPLSLSLVLSVLITVLLLDDPAG